MLLEELAIDDPPDSKMQTWRHDDALLLGDFEQHGSRAYDLVLHCSVNLLRHAVFMRKQYESSL